MERQFLNILAFSVLTFTYMPFSESFLVAEDHKHQEEDDHDDHKEGEEHQESGGHKEHGEEKHGHAEKDEHGHEGDHEESSPKFGPGKAILVVRNDGKTFQLSDESIKFLKIEFSKPQFVTEAKGAVPLLQIPRSALVSFQEKMGIYVQDEKWIQLVPIKIIKKINGHVLVQAEQLHSDALIATKGVPFIRTAHLEASGQGGEGHAH